MTKQRDHKRLERRRLRAAEMFERNMPLSQIGRQLEVSRQVVYRWHEAWQNGGQQALASKGPAGPKARITAQQNQQIIAALLRGPAAQGYKTQLWTLPRTADLIEHLTGVRYHPGHVWRILGQLGFSCQRPERRAIERNERAIGEWKRVKWPALKKKRGGKAG